MTRSFTVRNMGEDDLLKSGSGESTANPARMDRADRMMRSIETHVNDLNLASYDVTVSAGPDELTMRGPGCDGEVHRRRIETGRS